MPRFNFGDMVRYVEPHRNSGLVRGEVYEVVGERRGRLAVRTPNDRKGSNDGRCYPTIHSLWRFELATNVDQPHWDGWSRGDVGAWLSARFDSVSPLKSQIGWKVRRGELCHARVIPPQKSGTEGAKGHWSIRIDAVTVWGPTLSKVYDVFVSEWYKLVNESTPQSPSGIYQPEM